MKQKRTFLAIGECMIEMAPRRDGSYAMGYAGDSFNTAWYARRVAGDAVDVAFLSAIGDDAPSAAMAAFIETAGVRRELAIRPGGSVGLYLITLEAGERRFSYWRRDSAARSLANDLEALEVLGVGDVAYITGITLAILPEEGRTKLLSSLNDVRARGGLVAFDPNLRPALWPGRDAMRHWVTEAARVADVVLPSFEDEAAHFEDRDPAATAQRYERAGASRVVVKDGPGDVMIAQEGTRKRVSPPSDTAVVDTTAAGDSFNARFLIGLMQGEPTENAVSSACALAARVIGGRGALVDC
ncbi:MAG: sugar kinase [Pseudomonadota bacterium]